MTLTLIQKKRTEVSAKVTSSVCKTIMHPYGHFLKYATVYLTLTDDFDLGTNEKVLPQGIHMLNMKV